MYYNITKLDDYSIDCNKTDVYATKAELKY